MSTERGDSAVVENGAFAKGFLQICEIFEFFNKFWLEFGPAPVVI